MPDVSAVEKGQKQQSGDDETRSARKEAGEKGDGQPMGATFSESPESIFREEKENRLRLHRAPQGGIHGVEKDW